MARKTKKKDERGRKPLSREVLDNRRHWKKLLIRIFHEGRRPPSEDIVARVNNILKQWGSTSHVSVALVNQYCSIPARAQKGASKIDVRVPPTEEVANAFVCTLDEFGTWSHKIEQDIKQEEKRQLVELLGYKFLDYDSSSIPDYDKQSRMMETIGDREKLLNYLRNLCEDTSNKSNHIIHIYSAKGFHTSKDEKTAEAIVNCLNQGIQLLYVNLLTWSEYSEQHIHDSLKRKLKIVRDRIVPYKKKPLYYWYYKVDLKDIPILHTLFLRLGICSELTPKPLSESNLLTQILESKTTAWWCEHTLEIGNDETSSWYFSLKPKSIKPYLEELYDKLSKRQQPPKIEQIKLE